MDGHFDGDFFSRSHGGEELAPVVSAADRWLAQLQFRSAGIELSLARVEVRHREFEARRGSAGPLMVSYDGRDGPLVSDSCCGRRYGKVCFFGVWGTAGLSTSDVVVPAGTFGEFGNGFVLALLFASCVA